MMNKIFYKASIVLFVVYLMNIVVGKVSVILRDNNLPIGLESWQAALILFAAVCLFTFGIYKYEDPNV